MMGNMSYCRHENTNNDLTEVLQQWDSVPDSESELTARRLILQNAIHIVDALKKDGLYNPITGVLEPGAEEEDLFIDYAVED